MSTQEEQYIALKKAVNIHESHLLEESDVGTTVLSVVLSTVFYTYGVDLFNGNSS